MLTFKKNICWKQTCQGFGVLLSERDGFGGVSVN
jgi:hypothetical protein